MSIRTLSGVMVTVVCFVAVAGLGYRFLVLPQLGGNTPVVAVADQGFGWKFPVAKFPSTGPAGGTLAYSDIRDPGDIPEGLPVRLKIPVIGVDSAIEDALITPDGRMDVPAGSKNVAWFALGPHPGKEGSAVIGGHFGISNGVPFVFYDLDKLRVGDKIYVVDDKGNTLAFVVRDIKLFERDADATTVFTSNDGLAHLNLITCEGLWNQVNDTYPERRVVFTDALPEEETPAFEPVPDFGRSISAEATYVFNRSLSIGASGSDVESLQTILEHKGFLVMPVGVAKGFFGALTSAAISRYQESVGLPQAGVLGPLTRARLIAEMSPKASAPTLPSTAITARESTLPPSDTQKSPLKLPALIRAVKILFATPLDGLITSLLVISIVCMAFVLWRRLE